MTDENTVSETNSGSMPSADTLASSDASPSSDTQRSKKRRFGGGGTLDQTMPVLLFLGFYNFVSIEAAVVASTIWSFKAALSRRRRGLNIGLMLPSVTGYLILRSAVAIAAERELVDFGVSTEAVYFGIGFATKILVGVVLAMTILRGRPFMAWLVERLLPLPDGMAEHDLYKRTMMMATWFIVAFEILTAIWDIYLYNNTGVNLFVLTRFGVNFTLGFISITGGLIYIDHKLKPIPGYRGLPEMLQESSIIPDKSKTSSE